jgi:hypothetical protein
MKGLFGVLLVSFVVWSPFVRDSKRSIAEAPLKALEVDASEVLDEDCLQKTLYQTTV